MSETGEMILGGLITAGIIVAVTAVATVSGIPVTDSMVEFIDEFGHWPGK